MGQIKHRDMWTQVTAPFAVKDGVSRQSDIAGFDLSSTNSFVYRQATADNTSDVDLIGLDGFNRHLINSSFFRGARTAMNFNLQANANLTTAQRFFVADQPYEIRGIALQYDTADGAANTAFITKEVAGQAPGTGVLVQTGTFNLNTTANVLQTAVLASARNLAGVFGPQESVIALNTGEMLTLNITTAVTSLAGLNVTVIAIPGNSFPAATLSLKANAAITTQAFYLANRPVKVTNATITVTVPTSASGTITVTKDTGTNAPGAGTAIFTAINPIAAITSANTPTQMTLTATAATLNLAAGDRLSLLVSGTITALAGLNVTVSFANQTNSDFAFCPTVPGMTQLIFAAPSSTAAGTSAGFFIADRDYRVDDVSMVWSTAGSGNLTVTVDGTTVASGAGTSVLTDNTNTGPATTGTANTVVVGTLAVSKRTLLLPSGSRLSAKFAGTLGSLAGSVVAVSLLPW